MMANEAKAISRIARALDKLPVATRRTAIEIVDSDAGAEAVKSLGSIGRTLEKLPAGARARVVAFLKAHPGDEEPAEDAGDEAD